MIGEVWLKTSQLHPNAVGVIEKAKTPPTRMRQRTREFLDLHSLEVQKFTGPFNWEAV